MDVHLGKENGIDFVRNLRTSGHEGVIANISVDYSIEIIDQSVWSGADDFLIKNSNLSFNREVKSLLYNRCSSRKERQAMPSLPDSGFFRCIGVTDFERMVLNAIYPYFPTSKELAFMLKKTEGYVRKVISNIYDKFHISGSAELGRMLTLCSRFCQR
jgi:DNA-binding NarL/FixJ family response regulator